MANIRIKKGDLVRVIAGKDKGKDGKVLALDESMGGNTCYAFGNWQASVGLVRDEICGPKSWDKIANG